jgi:hypothetical protein
MSEEPSKLLILLGVPVCRSISPKSPLWHDRQADFSDEPQTLHSVGCAGLPGHSGATGKLSVCHSSPPYKGGSGATRRHAPLTRYPGGHRR